MTKFPSYENARSWGDGNPIPSEPGVYAIFLNSLDNVPKAWRPELSEITKPIYIGKSLDLKRRLNEHFRNNSATSSSTIRRSVAAMLMNTLRIRAIPKGGSSYDLNDESILSKWLQENFTFTFIEVEKNDLEDKESDYLDTFKPPFNIELKKRSNNPNVHTLLDYAKNKFRHAGTYYK